LQYPPSEQSLFTSVDGVRDGNRHEFQVAADIFVFLNVVANNVDHSDTATARDVQIVTVHLDSVSDLDPTEEAATFLARQDLPLGLNSSAATQI
jgi:hypothetical protein